MRNDIQFLRGFAVLAVVFYHAKLFALGGGFLGVDIFFVISGFLITSHILKDLESDRFSFKRFYIKRAKRLLPAAYSTLIVTSLVSYAVLTNAQWHDYLYQLFGTLTFSANLILPFQTGYFENAAEGKPLLHTWSLSVEEQYYLLIPLFLFVTSVRLRFWLLAASTLGSLALCYYLVSTPFTYWRLPTIDSATFAFYTLPGRAWELLVGSLLAWLARHATIPSAPRGLKYLAFMLLVYCVFFPFDKLHPRGDAIAVVLATALLISGRDDWLPSNPATRSMIKIGDWSYSLYLVHWPLFAFAHLAYLGIVPASIRVFLVAISVFLAYMQFQFVEQRFRFGWHADRSRAIKWLAGATVLVLLVPAPAILGGHISAAKLMNQNDTGYRILGLNDRCSQISGFSVPAACMTSAQPRFALWGDSYAMHLVPGLKADPQIGGSIVQLTKSACAPMRGVASLDANHKESWAADCLAFNEGALNYILNSNSIKYVMISSSFKGYFDYGSLNLYYDGRNVNGDREIAIARMRETIAILRKHGKQPIIIAPPPTAQFDVGECWGRKVDGLIVMSRSDCNIPIEQYRYIQRGIIDAIDILQHDTRVEVAWMDNIICQAGTCNTSFNNRSIYRDGGHLTVAGSEYIIPKLRIVERLAAPPLQE